MSDSTVPQKKCTICLHPFPDTPQYFIANKRGKNGTGSYCRLCKSLKDKERKSTDTYKKYHRHAERERKALPEVRQYYAIRWNSDAERNRRKELYRETYDSPDGKNRFIAKRHRRLARQLELPYDYSEDQWTYAINYFGGCCAVCGCTPGKEQTLALDHWIPLNSPECPGTVAKNIVPLCHGRNGCNNSKHDNPPEEWLIKRYGETKAKEIAHLIERYFQSLP